MKHLITTVLLSLVCASANAEWVVFGRDERYDWSKSTLFLDPAKKERAGDVVKIWILEEFDKRKKIRDMVKNVDWLIKSIVIEQYFDCKYKLARMGYITHYTGYMGTGRKTHSIKLDNKYDNYGKDWEKVEPRLNTLYDMACAK